MQNESDTDFILVSCVKKKLTSKSAAKDLYDSNYFKKMRKYAEDSGLPWFILSAEHGLVNPETPLEPYDCYLPKKDRTYRSEWGQRVKAQLENEIGSLPGKVFEVHAGAVYVNALTPELESSGASVVNKLRGLSFGKRLSWYKEHENGPEK